MAVVLKCDGCGAVSTPAQIFGRLAMNSRNGDGSDLSVDLCMACYQTIYDNLIDSLFVLKSSVEE